MNKCIQTGALLVAVLAMAAPGCKKKEEDKAPPAAAKTAVDTPPKADEPEAPKADVAATFAGCWAAWNGRDEAAMAKCYGEKSTYVHADGPPALTGSEAIVAHMKNFWTAFPDGKGEIQLSLVNGDKLAALVFMAGTNTGALKQPDGSDMPATGKKQSGHGIQFFDATDPANAAETDFWDTGLLMGQLSGARYVRPVTESTGLIEDAPVVATGGDVEKANLVLIEQHLADFAAKDGAGIAAAYSADAVLSFSGAPMDMKGTEQVAGFFNGFKGAFPDMKIASNALWAAGDYVYLDVTVTGKNTGTMPPMIAKATGKDIKLRGAEIYKITDGKISHQWIVVNGMAMAMQLGFMGEKPAEKK